MRLKWVVVLVAMAMTGVLAGGGWFAWQRGLLPPDLVDPPAHAPLAINFQRAIQAMPHLTARVETPCIPLPMHTAVGDRQGARGLEFAPVAGLASVGILLGDDGALPERAGALEALARAGLVDASDGQIDTGSRGMRPGRLYTLNFDGWRQMDADGCLRVGNPTLGDIGEFGSLLPEASGRRVWRVVNKVRFDNQPPWLKDEAFGKAEFGPLRQAVLEPSGLVVRLWYENDAWVIEPDPARVAAPTGAVVQALVGRAQVRPPRACIALPSAGEGVHVDPTPLVVHIDDNVPRRAGERQRVMFMLWRERMAALAKAGVFGEARVGPDPATGRVAGTRYELDPELQRWFDPSDPGCLAMGDAKLELLGVSVPRTPQPDAAGALRPSAVAQFALRLASDAWVLARAPDVPEARVARQIGGVPALAQLRWEATARNWALDSLVAQQARLEEPYGAMPVLNDELRSPGGAAVPIQVETGTGARAKP